MSRFLKNLLFSTMIIFCLFGVSNALGGEYPGKPITAVVPFPAGGSTDIMGRTIVLEFTEFFGMNVVVTNTAGGAGTIGLASIARARTDGYTIGIVPAAPLVNQPHMRKTPYNLDSFDYICQLFDSPMALAVKPGSPFKTLKELVEYAKEHPNELSYGSPGPGTLPHLDMENFLSISGIKVKHVPFTGDGPGITALLGGHIDMYMAIFSVVPDKNLTALAVFNTDRIESMPNLPTAIEEGFDATSSWWGGVIAPKGIPDEIKKRLTDACSAAATSERLKDTMEKLGTMVKFRNPADFELYVKQISDKNEHLIKLLLN